jgi:hypothetical protein
MDLMSLNFLEFQDGWLASSVLYFSFLKPFGIWPCFLNDHLASCISLSRISWWILHLGRHWLRLDHNYIVFYSLQLPSWVYLLLWYFHCWSNFSSSSPICLLSIWRSLYLLLLVRSNLSFLFVHQKTYFLPAGFKNL